MRIWCIPKATSLELPSLPPRIDRDVFIRSPPPPPRLSKQEKLAKGVIVYKNKRKDRSSKPPSHSSKASSLKGSGKPQRKVRYADLVEEEERAKAVKAEYSDGRVPFRGEIIHSRQQSNTSGSSSSGLGTSSHTASSASIAASQPQYSSSSGLGSSSPEAEPSLNCDNDSDSSSSSSSSSTSSSPESTLTSTLSNSYRSRRSDRSNRSSRTTRIKKTVSRSTLSLSVGGFSRRCALMSDLKKSNSCDDRNVILYPGISRTRERKDRASKSRPRRKGVKNLELLGF